MAKSLQDWLSEGEELYTAAMKDYREMEGQLAALQERMTAKRQEVNQIARVVGKPGLEGAGVSAAAGAGSESAVEVVEAGQTAPYTRNTIARALTGQPIRR